MYKAEIFKLNQLIFTVRNCVHWWSTKFSLLSDVWTVCSLLLCKCTNCK